MRARDIVLTAEEQADLELVARRSTSAVRDVFPARAILVAASGASNEQIAQALKTRPAMASKWRGRFLCRLVDGLQDAPRLGKPATYGRQSERRILTQVDPPPPRGYARWNGALQAAALKDISDGQIWRVLRKHGISLERRHSWCVSTDPCFPKRQPMWSGFICPPNTRWC